MKTSPGFVAFLAVAAIFSAALAPCLAGGYCGPVCAPAVRSYASPPYAAPVYATHAYSAPVYVPPAPQVQVVIQPIGIPISYQVPVAKQGLAAYTYSSASGPYTPLDPALFLQQSAKMVEQAQALAGNGVADFQATGLQIRETDAALEKIRAAAEAIQRVGSVESRLQNVFSAQSTASGKANPAASQAGKFSDVDQVLQAKCVSCHPGYSSWEKLDSDNTRLLILERITSAEPAKRMPLAPDKKSPGVPLLLGEKLLFMSKVSASPGQ